jgi:signal transduction histidine kinase
MTLVKDKKLQNLEQTLLTLKTTSITPNSSAADTPASKLNLSLVNTHHFAACSELLDIREAPKSRMSVEEEEKRISRELHDGLGQLLTSMNLHIQRCLDGCEDQTLQKRGLDEHKESLQALSSMVKLAMSEVRAICSSIRPAILDDLGVIAAVTWQCRQVAQIGTDFDVLSEISINETEIPEGLKTVIYRIVQESLINALKYSQAKQVKVSLCHTHNTIKLAVEDDGIGFDPAEINDRLGMGLMSMRERVESVNGFLHIETGVNRGVKISACFPARRKVLNG